MPRICAARIPGRMPIRSASTDTATTILRGVSPSVSATGRSARLGSKRRCARTHRSGTQRHPMRDMTQPDVDAKRSTATALGGPYLCLRRCRALAAPSKMGHGPPFPRNMRRLAQISRESVAKDPARLVAPRTTMAASRCTAARAIRSQTDEGNTAPDVGGPPRSRTTR